MKKKVQGKKPEETRALLRLTCKLALGQRTKKNGTLSTNSHWGGKKGRVWGREKRGRLHANKTYCRREIFQKVGKVKRRGASRLEKKEKKQSEGSRGKKVSS